MKIGDFRFSKTAKQSLVQKTLSLELRQLIVILEPPFQRKPL
jgi:hypothetical protein